MATSLTDTAGLMPSTSKHFQDQAQCPFFSLLPGEIREQIFKYSLQEYEDYSRAYDRDTCYRRPGYMAPRRCDTALLSTCQRVYKETWFIPWTSAEHTLWLAWPRRHPPRVTSEEGLAHALAILYEHHGKMEMGPLHIFAQHCKLEYGSELSHVLSIPYLEPRCITITLRHTDWSDWEHDAQLQLSAGWVVSCLFPTSVQEIRLELESLVRKSTQIDAIAANAVKHWRIRRHDGIILVAEPLIPPAMRWSGSSTWDGERWERDETQPGTLDYYVVTVTWRPQTKAEELDCKTWTNLMGDGQIMQYDETEYDSDDCL